MALSLMIPNSPPWLLFLSFLFVFHSSLIPLCHSQSSSPQNIETFYPPPTPPPPAAEPQPPTTESTGSSNGKIVKAVASTAAATFVVCGLIFFIVHRCLRRRRKQEAIVVPDQNQINGFERIGGNVKGLIIDENGLDVVYWRKLQGRSFKGDFQKEVFRSDNQNREPKENDGVDEGKKPEKVQEFPLLRGKSSTSHLPEGDDYSNRIVITARTNLPPTSAIPKRNSSAPPTTSPLMQPVPARKSSPPARSRPRPPPAPAAVKSSSKPPPTSRETPATSAAEAGNSSREVMPESGNGQVKLKPLHWDRMNSKADVASLSVDQDLMEALFGYVAINRRSPKGGRNDSSSQSRRISSQGQVRL